MVAGWPITSLRIYPHFGEQQCHAVWTLAPDFVEPRPYRFTLMKSGNGVDGWSPVATALDRLDTADPSVGMFSRNFTAFYKVVLTAGNSGKQYHSLAQGLYGNMTRDQFLVAKEIMRRQMTQMRWRGGNECMVLVRKKYGEKCTQCTDPIGGAVVAANVCTVCYGTGFVGGYETPVYTWAMLATDQPKEDKVGESGLELASKRVATIETIGFPIIVRGDILMFPEIDQRYDIISNTMNTVQQVPVKQSCAASLLPVTDVIYRFPIPEKLVLPDPVPKEVHHA